MRLRDRKGFTVFKRIVSKYAKWGGSHAVILPPPIRELLLLRPGDLILFTIVGESVLLTRLDFERQLPMGEARKLVAEANAS